MPVLDDGDTVKLYNGRDVGQVNDLLIGTLDTDAQVTVGERLVSFVTDINGAKNVKAYMGVDGSLNVPSLSPLSGSMALGSHSLTSAIGTAPSGTGITVNNSAVMQSVLSKVTLDYTAFQTGGTTNDVTVWTLPAKSRVLRVIADVTTKFIGGAISAVVLRAGKAANGNNYLLDGDVFTAAITLGDAGGEVGADLKTASWADITWASTQAVVVRLTSTTANLSALTQGSMTVYIEYCVYP